MILKSETMTFAFSSSLKKYGNDTKHQFEIALENYQKTGPSYILTTIKYVNNSDSFTQEVLNFMNRLDQELKHFYHFYNNIDQLKLWIIRQNDDTYRKYSSIALEKEINKKSLLIIWGICILTSREWKKQRTPFYKRWKS